MRMGRKWKMTTERNASAWLLDLQSLTRDTGICQAVG